MKLLRLVLLVVMAGSLLACGGGRPASESPASGPAPSGSSVSGSPRPGSSQPGPLPTARRPADADLVGRLRRGGHVLYIRHAATESTQDDPSPDLADPGTQRNLSDAGREQAREIGRGVRRLGIPIGRVLHSPYNRTRETAVLAFGAERPRPARELINEIYPGTDDEELVRYLRQLLRERPAGGVNTVLVSHGFNLSGATGVSSAEGDMVVFDPGARDPLTPVATIGADEWRTLKG